MTEIERIEYAKLWIDKLAKGINPLDDTPIPDGEVAKSVRISRCFSYVSGILQGQIDSERNKIKTAEKRKKPIRERSPFFVTPKMLLDFEYSSTPITVPALGKRINQLRKAEIEALEMQRFIYRKIYYWLHDIGMVEWREWSNGKQRRVPTAAGEELGLALRIYENFGRKTPTILLSKSAQRFVIDHMDAVMAAERGSIFPADEEDEES